MKKETKRSPKKAPHQEESRWVNVHDDNVMRSMGIHRPALQTPRDESVWTKTPKEKQALRNVKHTVKKKDMHFLSKPLKFIQVPGKLIIYLKKNKVYDKTTYSIECWESDVPRIVSKYVANNKNGVHTLVHHYYWNGQTYYPKEK